MPSKKNCQSYSQYGDITGKEIFLMPETTIHSFPKMTQGSLSCSNQLLLSQFRRSPFRAGPFFCLTLHAQQLALCLENSKCSQNKYLKNEQMRSRRKTYSILQLVFGKKMLCIHSVFRVCPMLKTTRVLCFKNSHHPSQITCSVEIQSEPKSGAIFLFLFFHFKRKSCS